VKREPKSTSKNKGAQDLALEGFMAPAAKRKRATASRTKRRKASRY